MNRNLSASAFFLRFNHFLKTRPVFLILLPAFFVLHGFKVNYDSVPVKDTMLLLLLYTGSSLIIAGMGWLFFRDLLKAGHIAFLVMTWHFFFGNIQDTLKSLLPHASISQYRFLLPVSFLFFLAIVIWLKKRKKPLLTLAAYLNVLLLVLLFIDAGLLTAKMTSSEKKTNLTPDIGGFTICDTCRKPDIFLILLDQYAGNTALKEIFNFDNSAFINELNLRGFHIAKESSSNYNLTPFSMASALNMDYLTSEMGVKNRLNTSYSYRVIRNNNFLQFLTATGYGFNNYSVFDFPGQPAREYGAFMPYGTKLITSKTFIDRLVRDIRFDILSGKLRFKSAQKKIAYEYLHFNDDIFELTRNVATKLNSSPKFVYAHFMMPHYPYYFDSKGNPMPLEKLSGFRKTNSNDYIEYLQYTNLKILQLVDHILSTSPAPPVIQLLGDHGFRHPELKTERKYDFLNLNAIFIPDKNYSRFYDSITNVNLFRIILNTCFGQHLSILKDSTIDLWD